MSAKEVMPARFRFYFLTFLSFFLFFKVVSVRHLQDGEGSPTAVSDKGGLAHLHLASANDRTIIFSNVSKNFGSILSPLPRSCCVSAGVCGKPRKSSCLDSS